MQPFVVRTVTEGDPCGVKTITTTYQGVDQHGNLSNQCERIVTVSPVTDVTFPGDEELDCGSYTSSSSDPSNTGEPSVVGLNNDVCKYTVTFVDEEVAVCAGVSADITKKIIRTWTVLNWCNGEIETDVQLITVSDRTGPSITVANTVIGTNTTVGGSHAICASSGLLPVAAVNDDCSGVSEVRVFTPGGEATAVTNNAGDVIGYSIPQPYLEIGTHTITYRAVDNCGNINDEDIEITVEDLTPPVPICREVTQISLNSFDNGLSAVAADYFNEASYDDCGQVNFKVRRMDSSCPGQSQDENDFNDEVHFCCDDVGETVMVILRVYDVRVPAGSIDEDESIERSNDCMIEVLVEDKSRPDCVAPGDVVTDCSQIPENLDFSDSDLMDDLFGAGSAIDNCGADITSTANVNLDLCGVGSVTRVFRARDAFGNVGVNTCRQRITVEQITDYCINLPADFDGECTNSNIPAELTFVENGCDLLAISVEENELLAGSNGDECKAVVRSWSIINWCEYDGVSSATVIARADLSAGEREDGLTVCSNGTNLGRLDADGNILADYASSGFYTYDQHVNIYDSTPPEVSYDGDTKFCGGDMDEAVCGASVDISIDVNDLCTSSTTVTWVITQSSDPTLLGSTGSGSIFGRYPLGSYTAVFSATDDCGNTSDLTVSFSTVDCKAPTPVCHNGLSIDVMPLSGMVELWASDFDASSFDYCHDFVLRANVVEDQNGDGLITSDDYQRTLPADDFIIVDCDDVGQPTMVQLWVSEQDGTADDGCADNQDDDFCVTFVEVQDNNGVCSGSKIALGGKVETEEAEAVENVSVGVNSGAALSVNAMTDASGGYSIGNLPLGGDYTIAPMKNDDVFNGVSTFDLLLISKHILNVNLLNSPYKVLAADANRSGNVSTLDLVAIRKVVLRESNSFPNNTSWRFVSKSQTFQNANNPWTAPIQEIMNYNDVATSILNVDFIGIKVGDVNGDAQANSILGVDNRSFNGNFEMNAADQNFEAGEEVAMTISSEELSSINGYQFTVQFNTKALELKDIEHGVTSKENFGLSQADNGYITVSWDGRADSKEAFTLVFNAKAGSTLSEEVAISSALTTAEAYIGTDYRNVSLNFGQTTVATTALYQNTPNPFKGETVIGFNMAAAASATMTISDVSGKVLKVVRGDYNKGYNTITLSSDELTTGVLYYQLDTDNYSQTMKMVVIK